MSNKNYYLFDADSREIVGPVTKSQATVRNSGMGYIHASPKTIEIMKDALVGSSQLEQGGQANAETPED